MSLQSMVEWALAQQGKSYSEAPGLRCGPNSFDCSGLVYKACVNGGVRPPGGTGIGCTTTFSQWADRNSNGNTLVSEFPTGTLVYFDNGDGGPQPGHVGISLGDGTMINALNTQYGVLVCPVSYGGTPMGGIVPPESGSNVQLTGQWVKDQLTGFNIPDPLGGVLSDPFGGPSAVVGGVSSAVSAVEGFVSGIDKIAGKLGDPTFMRRVGKGALAGLLGLVSVFILKEGISK